MANLVARQKRLKRNPRTDLYGSESDTFRVLCGFRPLGGGRDCSGNLGRACQYGHALPPDAEFERWGPGAHRRWGERVPARGDWYLQHPDRFERLDDGSYRVKGEMRRDRHGMRIGRSRIPEELRYPYHGRSNRGFVGRFPLLPAVVQCPDCRRPNTVEPPNATVWAPAMRRWVEYQDDLEVRVCEGRVPWLKDGRPIDTPD